MLNGVPNDDEELQVGIDDFQKALLLSILTALLEQGKLDEKRFNDAEYLWSVVKENDDMVDNLPAYMCIDDQFMEAAQEAVKADRPAVVVVLAATVIEHRLNSFYRRALEFKWWLSDEEATDAIRSNISTKLGWLLHVVTDHDLSEGIKIQIKQLMDLRNALVHYKAHLTLLDEILDSDYDTLTRQIRSLGLGKILKLPDELEDELEIIARSMWPSYDRAQKLTEVMFSRRR